jgi:hypothetical protein
MLLMQDKGSDSEAPIARLLVATGISGITPAWNRIGMRPPWSWGGASIVVDREDYLRTRMREYWHGRAEAEGVQQDAKAVRWLVGAGHKSMEELRTEDGGWDTEGGP